ncbi:MAG: S41 family peptidase [Candidatus Contendobacter sp.]|nr:S41 family peptidase [Candidatus Contendobacter sp.]MDG4559113.1 S41 family peptidase [Candidatus Contendobacter sp.]
MIALFNTATLADPASDLTVIAKFISQRHIDHPSLTVIPTDSLTGLQAFLAMLDPYSSYLNPQEFARENHAVDIRQPGIGALVTRNSEDGWILVPFLDGPAYRAGIHDPVKLIRVETWDASTSDLATLATLVKTRSRVRIEALDLITTQPVRATVRMKPFQVPPVEIIEIEGQPILRLHVFAENYTVSLLRQALKQLASADKPLVIDLRYATGGDLLEALDSISLILPRQAPIATTVTSDQVTVTFKSRNDQRVAPGPVYLLIGPNTVSAAEVFTRALHYYGYAVLVGQSSFGKCLTQQLVELPAKDGLKLTVGRILDPAGQYCAGRGIAPDVSHNGNIHDTAALLRLIEVHNQTHRLVCRAELYRTQLALEQGITQLGWNQDGGKYQPISLITPAGNWRLCLGPSLAIPAALSLQKTLAKRLDARMLLFPLFPALPPIDLVGVQRSPASAGLKAELPAPVVAPKAPYSSTPQPMPPPKPDTFRDKP